MKFSFWNSTFEHHDVFDGSISEVIELLTFFYNVVSDKISIKRAGTSCMIEFQRGSYLWSVIGGNAASLYGTYIQQC